MMSPLPLIVLFVASTSALHQEDREAPECITIAGRGKAPNKPCLKGKWTYRGKEYEGCSNPSNNAGGPWCPTEKPVGNWGWGYCNMDVEACKPPGERKEKDEEPVSPWISSTSSCITVPGKQPWQKSKVPNAPCVFPWKYGDDPTVYYGCANPSNAKLVLNGNWEYPYQWCPTELDNEGKYVSGKWGYCMDYDADWLPDACDPVVQSGCCDSIEVTGGGEAKEKQPKIFTRYRKVGHYKSIVNDHVHYQAEGLVLKVIAFNKDRNEWNIQPYSNKGTTVANANANTKGELCPNEVTEWKYWNGFEFKVAAKDDLNVTCCEGPNCY